MSEWSALKEIAEQYKAAAEPFRAKRDALRVALRNTEDREQRSLLKKSISALSGTIEELEMMAECASRYYDRDYYRDDRITCNGIQNDPASRRKKETGASVYQPGTDDNAPTGYATNDYTRITSTSKKKPDPFEKMKRAFKY